MKFDEQEKAKNIILRQTTFLPRDAIVKQLEFVRSWVSFLANKDQESILSKLALLSVADEIKKALRDLCQAELLTQLIGVKGVDLVNKVKRELGSQSELLLITAVNLDHEFKKKISQMCSSLNRRVVFKVDSSLVAGVVFVDGDKVIDYSIQNNIKPFLKSFYSKKL